MMNYTDKKFDLSIVLKAVEKYKITFYYFLLFLCMLIIFYLYPVIKTDILKISLVPIIYATFFFGYKKGILTMVITDVILITYLSFLKVAFSSYSQNYFTGKVIAILVFIVIGNLAKMYKKVIILNEELKKNSLCDSLTGLYNRRYYTEVVTGLVRNFTEELTNSEVWKRDPDVKNCVIGICMVDIDHFKSINDKYGHNAGDQVLKELSSLMKGLLRFDDIVIRWGGEEFIILLTRTKIDYLPHFLRLLKSSVSNRSIDIGNGQSIKVNVSGGCISYPYNTNNPRGLSFEECINFADMLLYFAKKTGRNRLIMLKQAEPYLDYDELQKLMKSVAKENQDYLTSSQYFEVI